MAAVEREPDRQARLAKMIGFVEVDPTNLRLIADTVSAAVDAQDWDAARDCLARHEAVAPLPPSLVNLAGVTALAEGRHVDAEAAFTSLVATGEADPGIRFNLAWAKAMLGDFAGAAELLNAATIATSPRAPALAIRALHHLDRYDEALARGEVLLRRYPNNRELLGALSTLALDADRADLAASFAAAAGDDPAGLTTRATLMLDSADPGTMLDLFEQLLAHDGGNPRAWIGKGLSLLSLDNPTAAATALDQGAEQFGDHLGSWIAAGWAYYIAGDVATSRARFIHAIEIDDRFAETHGALAVLDIAAGDFASARQHAEVAQRLDRASFAGALANAMLAEYDGKPELAETIRARALHHPIGASGRTLNDALTAMARGRKSPGRH